MIIAIQICYYISEVTSLQNWRQTTEEKWSTQAMSFRPNPVHANYFLNVYNMSSMYLNKILFKPNYRRHSVARTLMTGLPRLFGSRF